MPPRGDSEGDRRTTRDDRERADLGDRGGRTTRGNAEHADLEGGSSDVEDRRRRRRCRCLADLEGGDDKHATSSSNGEGKWLAVTSTVRCDCERADE